MPTAVTWAPDIAARDYGTGAYAPLQYTTVQAVQPYSSAVQTYYGTARPDTQLYSRTVQCVDPRRFSQCTMHRARWLADQYAYAGWLAGWLT